MLGRGEEVEDPVDRLGGVERVDRREDEVPRLGRGERGADGGLVAHLADQDHVGVLAQHPPQRGLERVGVAADLALVDRRASGRWCRYSIGSSIVTMCLKAVSLMCSIIAASVVDFPHPVVPVTSTIPRSSSAEPADHLGQAEVVERADRVGDHPEDHRDAPPLQVAVDAEARQVRDGVGEVDLAHGLELLHARVGEHRVQRLHRVARAEFRGVGVEPAQLAVDADQRAVAGLQAEIRAARSTRAVSAAARSNCGAGPPASTPSSM